MATIIEAIYEDGVLRPLDTQGLEEQHRYRLIVEEVGVPETTSSDSDRVHGRDARDEALAGTMLVA